MTMLFFLLVLLWDTRNHCGKGGIVGIVNSIGGVLFSKSFSLNRFTILGSF